MRSRIVTRTDTPPVTWAEAHLQLRLDGTATEDHPDRGEAMAMLEAARDTVEHLAEVTVGQATRRLELDRWPSWAITAGRLPLPMGPVATLNSVHIDGQAWAATLDTGAWPESLVPPAAGWAHPQASLGGIVIVYTTSAAVPPAAKRAMLLLLTHSWRHRAAVSSGAGREPVELPMGVELQLSSVARGFGL